MCVFVPRLMGPEESAWGDEEENEHNYYNSIPGKEPPPGGLVDSRLTLTQPGALGQVSLWVLWGGYLTYLSLPLTPFPLMPSPPNCIVLWDLLCSW